MDPRELVENNQTSPKLFFTSQMNMLPVSGSPGTADGWNSTSPVYTYTSLLNKIFNGKDAVIWDGQSVT
jgi:hypothetical protein